jgi:hypothetical protein
VNDVDSDSDDDGSDRWTPQPVPRRPSAGVVVGRMMLGLEEIVEGKPPREAYEQEQESDQSGEPFDPDDPNTLIIEI